MSERRVGRVLITGGGGLIGSRVAAELLLQGVAPVVFDIREPRQKIGEVILGDILDPAAVTAAMKDVDAVLHMASLISVETTEKRPTDTLDVAILGTRNVCRAARKGQRVVLSSTSEIYGDAAEIPTPEESQPAPKSVYGIAKLACEQYLRAMRGPDAPEWTILRYFSVYGPGQSTGFVVPKFVLQALRGEPLTLYGDGQQVRSFSHVDDVAHGTVLSLLAPVANGRTYNLGDPAEPMTMEQLAGRIVHAAGSGSPIVKVPFTHSDRAATREIYHRIPSIEAARRDLGYQPTRTFDQGIHDVIRSLQP